jgi:4-aminobutyrate aminotransferase-like enzyme
MENVPYSNDISAVVDADRAHLWHHLIQHKQFETIDPRIIIEGKGMRVWDARGKEYLDAVSGGVWTVNVGYGRESIANAVRDQCLVWRGFTMLTRALKRMKKCLKWCAKFRTVITVVRNLKFFTVNAITMAPLLRLCLQVANLNG